jgi:DNA excision repair protein ERCC-2
MITVCDPGTRSVKVGIRELIDLWWLPVTLRPSQGYLDLAARQRRHSSWQRTMEREGWEREVRVSMETTVGDVDLTICGRIDLLRDSGGAIELLEAKTCFLSDLDRDPLADNLDHVLQLTFYARALTADPGNAGRRVEASLAYLPMLDVKAGPQIIPVDPFTGAAAEAWDTLLADVASEIEGQRERYRVQMEALGSFVVPFPRERPGQREMIETAAAVIEQRARALVQAPAGTGKTAAVLTGSIPGALRGNLALFFLTAKNTQKKIVRETMELFAETGVRTLFLSSRESVCLQGTEYCRPETCPWAEEFAARVRGTGLIGRLLGEGSVTPERLVEAAREAAVCPFELSLALSTRCDLIVCDYNYVFDPHVYLRRFFLEESSSGRCAVLIDEAANLPDRARGYYSPEIRLSWLEGLAPWLRKHGKPFRSLVSPWRKLFARLSEETPEGEPERELDPGTPMPLRERRWRLAMPGTDEPPAALIELYRGVTDFARIGELRDGRFHLVYRTEPGDRVLQWFCTDSSAFLAERHDSCHSTLAFSATLKPFDHFGYLLGLPPEAPETVTVEIPYPFPPGNLRVSVDASLDTRYGMRRSQLPGLASRIVGTYREDPGTWMVFFPSYGYMEMALAELSGEELPILSQTRGMTSAEREEFVSRVESGGRMVFTVTGGIFSEGVDLRIPDLKGAVIVGPCLPGVDLRSRLLAGRFEELERDPFLHTWAIPGMNRVVQAAGRLIRDSGDRARIVLVGRRFTLPPYLGLMPSHWFTDGMIELL